MDTTGHLPWKDPVERRRMIYAPPPTPTAQAHFLTDCCKARPTNATGFWRCSNCKRVI